MRGYKTFDPCEVLIVVRFHMAVAVVCEDAEEIERMYTFLIPVLHLNSCQHMQ